MIKDNELHEWKPYRNDYLDELLFLEGYRGFSKVHCPTCSADSPIDDEPLYRCRDCFIGQPVCRSCCLSAHAQQPLHVIEVNLFFLSRFSLYSANIIRPLRNGTEIFSNAYRSKN
jgi:hypothetical protein